MALGRNHRIFNIGNSSGSYGISRVYHDETLSGDGTLSSLLGVVDAGDTEVNEFVYNNSGDIIDVNNVVQTNSAQWSASNVSSFPYIVSAGKPLPLADPMSGFITNPVLIFSGAHSWPALTRYPTKIQISAYGESKECGWLVPASTASRTGDSDFFITWSNNYKSPGWQRLSVYQKSATSGADELASAFANIPSGDAEVNTYVQTNSSTINDINNVVQSNSANWNEVSSKLDASAFDPNEFYPMTGNPSGFLTAVDLSNYYTKSETSGADELANAFANIPTGDFSEVVFNSAVNYYRPEYGVSGISGRELYAISSKYAALDEHGNSLLEPYNYINNNSARIGDVVLNYEITSASYVVVNDNSANWNEISAYQQNSANYLTAHQSLDGYATTAWVEEQGYLTAHQDISNKLDVSAFTAWSASQEDNNYELSAGDGISLYDDDVNKITRIDVTAQGGNPEVESYVQTNSGTIDDAVTAYQNASGNYLTAIPNTVSINVLSASQRVRVGSNNINYSHLDGAGFYFKNGNDRPYNIGIDNTASNFYIATAHNGYARIYASSISGWNDVLNTYQTASSTYLTAINIPTSADWNESTNVVQTNSGTWNGVSSKLDTSAFTLSALNDASANNIVLTASLPATPDANTLYLIPET